MDKFYNLSITLLFIFLLSQNITKAQTNPEDPRFTVTAKNILTTNPTGTGGRDSICRFEIWVQQINQGQPGVNDFEYCAGQFTWSYNRAIQTPGKGLFFGLSNVAGANGLPVALRPPSFSVDSVNGFLKMSGNLPQSQANFFISGTFPGTKILTAQIRTANNRFPSVPLNLRFKLGASPNTFLAYFLPYPDSVDSDQFPSQTAVALMDTLNPGDGGPTPVYVVESGNFIFPPGPTSTPVANFYTNTTTIFAGGYINFLDSSLNNPTSWSWSFPGGTPSTSTIQNPAGIVYNIPGVYSVSLTATNSNGPNTKTKTNYINVISGCTTIWKNTIKISDAGNIKDSLILGTSPSGTNNIDTCLGERSLPPIPPGVNFDVRFLLTNDASKIDIRKDTSIDKTWILRFQPSAAGYPITFTWNINSFPQAEFFYLRDLVGGSVVNINMLSQNSLTLTNSGINSLKIEYTNKINKTIALKSGWNILSVPLLKTDMKVTSLFPTAASFAYTYNNGYLTADSLKNGKGYWLKFNADTTYNILGVNVTPKNINVISGWNLIGPFDENIPVNSLISVPSGIINSSIYGFLNMYFITDTLKAGKGYWVRTSASGILMKGASDNPVALTSENADSINSWTRISFTDPENSISDLYLANSNQITQNYDLPPVPPEGILDVRFGSDKSTETFGQSHIVKINSTARPLKIKVSNLKDHRIRLADAVTGNLFNVVLIEGVEIELSQNLDNLILTDEGIIPEDYSLSQNYPNPFNPSTTINYSVPEDGSVKIVIYDLAGKEVQTLVNKFVKTGTYEIKFNGSNLSSGIYIYKMQSGKFLEIKRMVLLK